MAIKLLTTKQAAEMLQLSASTLEDWRWKRIGPRFIRVSGGCIRYDEVELEAWLKGRVLDPIPYPQKLA
jgi:predicted DNA-binding transcriptional regulator AlpA